MVRTNQGGSILSFVIIGVVLTSLLVGGVYVVHQRAGAKVAATQPSPATKTPTLPGDTAPATSDSSHNGQSSPDAPTTTPSSNDSSSTTTPAPTQQSPSPITLPSGSTDTSSAPSSTTLPHTGPAESLLALGSVGLLVFAFFSYTRSRRALIHNRL